MLRCIQHPQGRWNIRGDDMLNTRVPVKQSISKPEICKPDVNVILYIPIVLLQNQALCGSFNLNKEKNGVTSEPKMKVGNPRPSPTSLITLNVREGSEWAGGYRAPRPDFPRMTVARRWTCLQRPYREVPQRGWREEEWKQNTAVSCGNLPALTVVGQAQGVTPETPSEIPWLWKNASTIIFEERLLDMTKKEGRM